MGRDWRVDTLRGWFLVCMTLAHLPPHPLQSIVGYMFGFASAPDGFVFLSGLVSSWVYLRVRAKQGQKGLEGKALRRLRDIYATHVGILSMTIVGSMLLAGSSFRGSHPLQAFVAGCLLIYQPHTCDILPMYCIFLLFMPLILEQFHKGRTGRVGMISLLLWLISQRGIGDPSYVLPYIDLGTFNLFAWQAYFVAGLYFGYRGLHAEGPVLPRSRTLLAICMLVSFSLFVQRHFEMVNGISLIKFHLSPDHNPLRFLNAAGLAYIVWLVPRRLDLHLMRLRFCRFLNYLGKHSLQVFAWSLPLTNFISYFHLQIWDDLSGGVKVLATLLTVACLAIPAKLHEQYRQRQTKLVCRLEYESVS
jgi:hypothetical protein